MDVMMSPCPDIEVSGYGGSLGPPLMGFKATSKSSGPTPFSDQPRTHQSNGTDYNQCQSFCSRLWADVFKSAKLNFHLYIANVNAFPNDINAAWEARFCIAQALTAQNLDNNVELGM